MKRVGRVEQEHQGCGLQLVAEGWEFLVHTNYMEFTEQE